MKDPATDFVDELDREAKALADELGEGAEEALEDIAGTIDGDIDEFIG